MEKNLEQRINNIIGQLQGVGKMIKEENKDCLRIITQLKAAKSAISSLMEKYMQEEFDSCLNRSLPKEKEELKKIFSQIAKN